MFTIATSGTSVNAPTRPTAARMLPLRPSWPRGRGSTPARQRRWRRVKLPLWVSRWERRQHLDGSPEAARVAGYVET